MSFLESRKTLLRLKNEWKKITISFILAFVFWFFLSRMSYVEKKVVFPLSYKNLPANLMIVEGVESNVGLIIRAKDEFFKNSNLSNLIKPVVYLDNAKTGVLSYPIDIILNTPVQDISVKLLKNDVKLLIDEIAEAEVEVKPNLSGIPGKGYFVEDLTADIKKIKIHGPRSVILTQSCLSTIPISVEGLTTNLFTNTYIILPENIATQEKTNISIEVIIKPLSHGTN
ncbi:MAG: hypothetical protein ACP5QT_05205 [Brevinematia bacterium]